MGSLGGVGVVLLGGVSSAVAAPAQPGDILVTNHINGVVINARAGGDLTLAPRFATGLSAPADICLGPANRVYVVETDSGEVTDITDGGDFTGATPFVSGLSYPLGIACTSTRMFVTDGIYTNAPGEVIEITGGTKRHHATVPDLPMRLMFDAEGRIMVSVYYLGIYDVTTGTPTLVLGLGGRYPGGMTEANGRSLAGPNNDAPIFDFTQAPAFVAATLPGGFGATVGLDHAVTVGTLVGIYAGEAETTTTIRVLTGSTFQPFATGLPFATYWLGIVLYAGYGDYDIDTIDDALDNCPRVANVVQADSDGDGLGDACDNINDLDADNDTILNANDNCPYVANMTQIDTDGDGLGNACDPSNGLDVDGDTVVNTDDNCPFDANTNQTDTDSDGLGDVCDTANGLDVDNDTVTNANDNCPFEANTTQADADGDGLGDACDATNNNDADADGVTNTMDNCAFDANTDQADADADGLGDACDAVDGTDFDADGVKNAADNCPFQANANQADADHDGLGDGCDPTKNEDDVGCCSAGRDPAGPFALSVLCLAFVLRRRVRRPSIP